MLGTLITLLSVIAGYYVVNSYQVTSFRCFEAGSQEELSRFVVGDIKVEYIGEGYDSYNAYRTLRAGQIGPKVYNKSLFVMSWNHTLFVQPVKSIGIYGMNETGCPEGVKELQEPIVRD